MITFQQIFTSFAIACAGSGALAAAVYILEGRMHAEYDKEFFRGTFLGTIKLLLIYLIAIPVILASPGPAALLSGFRLVLLGLVTILLIELFVYIFTHFVESEKELFVIGIIGGITRSEAVIAEFLEELKESAALIEETALIVLIASTTMIFRNLAILAIVMFPLFVQVFIPLFFIGAVSTAIFYYTYKKTEIDDIKLKAVSLRTAFIIVFLFSIVTAITQFLSAYPALLYLVAIFGALAGALPIVFTVVTLLTFGQIELAVGATMVVLASAVAYADEAIVALLFKQKALAQQLFVKQVPISLAAILLHFYLSGQLSIVALPAGVPWYMLLLPVLLVLVAVAILIIRKRRAGDAGYEAAPAPSKPASAEPAHSTQETFPEPAKEAPLAPEPAKPAKQATPEPKAESKPKSKPKPKPDDEPAEITE